jgi:hypothetical protein
MHGLTLGLQPLAFAIADRLVCLLVRKIRGFRSGKRQVGLIG